MPASPRTRSARRLAAVSLVAASLCVGAFPALARAADARSRPVPEPVTLGMRDGLARALATGRLTEAQYALERAASLFDPRGVARRFGDVARPDPRLATTILRDVAVRLRDLWGTDRERAIDLLSRPDDSEFGVFEEDDPEYGGRVVSERCDAEICVNFVDEADSPMFDHAASSEFADQVLASLQEVWNTETGTFQYREPKPDGKVLPSTSNGGDSRFDVYLANLGSGGSGLFGYCTTNDAKLLKDISTFDVSAYCVLDDDYVEYSPLSPTEALRVTTAHEFFHAVQFAYDFTEDTWLMEGTATWIEDEIFDAVNDHHNFLSASPLGNPTVPLDKGVAPRHYGAWIWWRFLSESEGVGVIRHIWDRADSARNRPDDYSTKAVVRVLKSRKFTFGRAFADFGARNVQPASFYEEGVGYGSVTMQVTRTISGSNRSFSSKGKLDHMTSRFIGIDRGSGVQDDGKLKISVDGPNGITGPQARAVLLRSGGGVTIVRFKLDAEGRGTRSVDFGSSVTRAVVIVSNASTRFARCAPHVRRTKWSCAGQPVDENLGFKVSVALRQ